MKVLINIIDGIPDWPDSVDKFAHPGEVISEGLVIEYFGDLPLTEYASDNQIYFTQNDNLSVSGQPLPGLNDVYYAPKNDVVILSTEIIDAEGNLQSQLDQNLLSFPPVLKMPLVKMVGGINGTAVDEIYFNVTLIEGVLTAEGEIPSSGDWKLLTDRVNMAIQSVGAKWKVDRPNITFLV